MRAFTLVELAIVLVIIGLLVGGVVAGQSLVESSKISSITADFNKYSTAYRAFYLEYNYMPGDMPNASDYFGSACGSADYMVQSGCNGNGNKFIQFEWTEPRECQNRAWKQMFYSRIIPDSDKPYTQHYDAMIPGVSAPKTAIDGATFMYCSAYGHRDATGYYGQGVGMPFLRFFGTKGVVALNHSGPAVTAKVAKKIDEKFDDGTPDKGKMYVIKGALTDTGTLSSNCVTSDYRYGNATTSWILNSDAKDCEIRLVLEKY